MFKRFYRLIKCLWLLSYKTTFYFPFFWKEKLPLFSFSFFSICCSIGEDEALSSLFLFFFWYQFVYKFFLLFHWQPIIDVCTTMQPPSRWSIGTKGNRGKNLVAWSSRVAYPVHCYNVPSWQNRSNGYTRHTNSFATSRTFRSDLAQLTIIGMWPPRQRCRSS